MKKLLLIFAIVLIATLNLVAQTNKPTEVTKIYDGVIALSPSATTWTVCGSIVTTSTSFTLPSPFATFSWDCDTLSFIVEVYSSASILAGESDSSAIDLRIFPTSPTGLTDSTAWATWTQVMHKSTIGGRVCFGTAVTLPASSNIYGGMKVLIGLKTGDAESLSVRIWRVRKWRWPQ